MHTTPVNTPRERILTALAHREGDRVPFDLGGSGVTGIHEVAYRRLRDALGLPLRHIDLLDIRLGLAAVHEDVRDVLGVDASLVPAEGPSPDHWRLEIRSEGPDRTLRDEFGVGWRQPPGGLYFDVVDHPLSGDIGPAAFDGFSWPDASDPHRFRTLRERAERVRSDEGRAVVVGPMFTGPFEMAQRLRGFQDYLMDIVAEPGTATALLDRAIELKVEYWEGVFNAAGDLIDVVYETDDYGTQRSLLISPSLWRSSVKPRLRDLVSFLHSRSGAKVMLHSCGAIREIIPELIEVGIDVLNPVQIGATGMDASALKSEFGCEIVFWGGGIDTQQVLPNGTPGEVRDLVMRRLDELMPGGGFVFAAVHNIQADVPPENIIAMWQAVREHGTYGVSHPAHIEGAPE